MVWVVYLNILLFYSCQNGFTNNYERPGLIVLMAANNCMFGGHYLSVFGLISKSSRHYLLVTNMLPKTLLRDVLQEIYPAAYSKSFHILHRLRTPSFLWPLSRRNKFQEQGLQAVTEDWNLQDLKNDIIFLNHRTCHWLLCIISKKQKLSTS